MKKKPVKITLELHKRLKIFSVLEGVEMQDAAEEAISDFLAKKRQEFAAKKSQGAETQKAIAG